MSLSKQLLIPCQGAVLESLISFRVVFADLKVENEVGQEMATSSSAESEFAGLASAKKRDES